MSTNIQGSLPDYPLVYAGEPVVRLAIVYNPFDLTSTAKHELAYGQSRTLADYMVGLPEEVEWNVAYNGELVPQDQWASTTPAPFSNITVVRVPEGGGGDSGKTILRVVALIAVMTFAAWAGPMLAGAMMGTTAAAASAAAAGSALGMAASAATAVIGVAGSMAVNALLAPKAPAQEKVSTAYGVDGAKNSAREGVVTPVTYGDFRLGGNVSDLFTRNFGEDQYLYIRTILNDGEVEDITDIELNGQPLSSFQDVQVRIRKGELEQEPNDWFDETVRQFNRGSVITTAWTQHVTDGPVDRLRADVAFPGGLYFAKDDGRKILATVNLDLQYSPVGTDNQPTGAWASLPLQGGASTSVSGASSRTLRLTYESATLPRGRYAIRIRRTTGDDETDKRTDACYLTDFGEIEDEPTNVNGVANLSLRVKMTDQLSGIPTVTALVKGSKVNIYDEDGNVVAFEKSANPADIVADLLFNQIRGGEYAPSKMVWPRYVEFREHCAAEGFEFHGTFDAVESLWDVAQTVAARGRGTLLPRGTKFTLVIDRATPHEMVFTPANMYRDTFKTTWVSTSERANEIQLVFFDNENGHKQRTIRIVDNVAFARGEKVKVASASGLGIVTVADAIREAEFAARTNRYIKKMVEFDAPLEAIGIGIGDVALVQHNSMDFSGGLGGRLAAGSTTTEVVLDADATMVAGKQYSLIVIESAIKRFDATITGISGSRITVSGLPDSLPRIRRLIAGGVDVEVLGYAKVGSTWRLTVSDGANIPLGPCELWDTDVVEERDVVTVTGEHRTLQLAQPLTQAPSQYSNFMFGEKVSVKKPFRLKSIAGSDVDRRTLSFVQYDERVYQRGGFDTIEVDNPAVRTTPQVTGLTVGFDRNPLLNQERLPVTLTWQKPADVNHAGVDIYYDTGRIADISLARWKTLGQAFDVSTFEKDFQRGEIVRFKVVAFDVRGQRAPFAEAPTFETTLNVFDRDLEMPQDVTYTVPLFRGTATARLAWVKPTGDFPTHYRVESVAITEGQRARLQSAINTPVYIPATQPDDAPEYRVIVPDDIDLMEGWQSLTTSAETIDVPNLDIGPVAFRVRAETATATSRWVWVAGKIEAVSLPTGTNLRLNGILGGTEFHGRDASFSWDDIIDVVNTPVPEGEEKPNRNIATVWKDYQVEILDGENVVRTEFTSNPFWTYTFDKNADDTPDQVDVTARRQFTFRLSLRGLQGQLSDPVSLTCSNPRPSGIPVRLEKGAISVSLIYQRPLTTDFGGIIVWSSTTPNNPAAPIVAEGPSTAIWALPQGVPSYYRYAFYDLFDRLNLQVSAEQEVEGTGIEVPDIDTSEIREIAEGVRDDLNNLINLTDPTAGTLGSRFLDTEIKVDGYEGQFAGFGGVLDGYGELIQGLGEDVDNIGDLIGDDSRPGTLRGRLALQETVVGLPDGSGTLFGRIAGLEGIVEGDTFIRSTQLSTLNANIAARVRTFVQTSAPTGSPGGIALATGDLWIDSDDNNRLYRRQGSSWVDVSAVGTRTYVQDEPPTANLTEGDIWFDSNNNMLQHRWTGAAWQVVGDPRVNGLVAEITDLKDALSDLEEGTATVVQLEEYRAESNLRNRTFSQPEPPVSPVNGISLVHGDLWMDSDNGNRIYRWNGSTWVFTDNGGASALAELETARGTHPNLSARFGNLTTSVADALAGKASTTRVETLEAEVQNARGGQASLNARFTNVYADLAGRATTTRVDNLANTVTTRNRTIWLAQIPSNPYAGEPHRAGDMWINNADWNKVHIWDGSGWAYAHDDRGGYANTRVTEIDAKIGVIEGTVADALAGKAAASRVETMEARINLGGNGLPEGDIAASIRFAREVAAQADGRAAAIIGLTSNVNGVITGTTSINNGTRTSFEVMSDNFRIVPSTAGSSFQFSNGLMAVTAANGQRVFELTW